MQLAHEGLVDLAYGRGEAAQLLVDFEARGLNVIGDLVHLPFDHFSLGQL